MFKTLKMINTLNVTYGLTFAEILSDNGAEFASRIPDRFSINLGSCSAMSLKVSNAIG